MKPDPSGFDLRPISLIGPDSVLPENSLASTKEASPHMTLAESLLKQLENPTLTRDERAHLQCQIADDFEHRGEYETARDVLGELWQGVGKRPLLEGLSELTPGEVLLRVGSLSAWFASVGQIDGAQEKAKDLISESIRRFQAIGDKINVAVARSELGLCYRRAGSYDEARVVYHEALTELNDGTEKELRAKILLRLVIVESLSGRYNDALRILTEETQFFEESTNDFLKGKFHNDFASVLTCLSTTERRSDYTDRAIIEYTAASHHFEQAGHTSYRASAENNLGFLLYTIGRYEEAHKHLNAARRLFADVQNKGRIAQVDETRARVLLAQGRPRAAESAVREAVRVLSEGGEQGLLAEAQTTQGRVLSKLGNFVESLSTLRRAADLAEQTGAVEDAGKALLTLMEEHADRVTEDELLETYERAHNLLKDTQDAETITRLRACALRIVSNRRTYLSQQRVRVVAECWAKFDLSERVRAYEARFIRQALIEGEGSGTRAARLLELHHHATLAAMLDEGGRHKDLAYLRTPPEPRKQSIINGVVAALVEHEQKRGRSIFSALKITKW